MARAEGTNARVYRVSTEPTGIGTLDGAHPPTSGTAFLALSSDVLDRPVWSHQAGVRDNPIPYRVTIDPTLTFGLPSSFALMIRAPFIVQDKGFDVEGRSLSRAGGLPLVAGVLVPIARMPGTNARVSARAEVGLPVGRQESFRGDGGLTGRLGLVFGGPVGPLFTVLSGGIQLAPQASYRDASVGNVLMGGIGLRFPDKAPVAVFASMDARFEVPDKYRPSGLASGGLEVRFNQSVIRILGGAGVGDTIATPRSWVGLAWIQSVDLFPGYYDKPIR
ncbi:MAG: hypothetical protein HY898_17420 [Deltaproteobacteria bacterium]|nr:hypothetical protein [Deltaproteobacteria bacterium]